MPAIAFRFVAAAVLTAGAWSLATAAEGDSITVDLKSFKFKVAENLATLFGYDEGESRVFYYTAGAGETTIKLPAEGEYELVVKASGDPAQGERAKFKVSLDGEAVGKETQLTDDFSKEYAFTLRAKAGEHKLAIEYTNDVYKEGEYDRNFYIHALALKAKK
jgi:hypothetical protein